SEKRNGGARCKQAEQEVTGAIRACTSQAATRVVALQAATASTRMGVVPGEWFHEASIRTWTDEWSSAKGIKQLGRRAEGRGAADICAQRNMLNNAMREWRLGIQEN